MKFINFSFVLLLVKGLPQIIVMVSLIGINKYLFAWKVVFRDKIRGELL